MPRLRLFFLFFTALGCLAPCTAIAQSAAPVVMLSDIHFDPFHNPQLFPRLQAAPITDWPAILNTPGDLHEDADRAKLQLECKSQALDTGWLLLVRSLQAAQDAEAHPAFVTLTGDLLAHEFPCRFQHLAPGGTPAQLSAFSAKTMAFVAAEVREAYPHTPVLVALGNNDSACADYAETPGSPFLLQANDVILAGVEQGAHGDPRWHPDLQTSPVGDYSVAMPPPMQHGRLIVLNDIYDSVLYHGCGGTVSHPEDAQIAWLHGQLAAAQAAHAPVWVMGHIPPGIDVYGSFFHYVLHPLDICSAQPRTLLKDDRLADTLLDFAGTVRLALFAHTHMDEIRVLERKTADGREQVVPVKLVPAITPYIGNHPAFLVASVNPRTLVLEDWRAFVSPAPEGSVPPWTEAYRYTTAYHMPDFSAASALTLAQGFVNDRHGRDERSHLYREHFYAGDIGLVALGLEQVWPAYACAVRQTDATAFHSCLCPAGNDGPPATR